MADVIKHSQLTKSLVITDSVIIYGDHEYMSATDALDAYINDFEQTPHSQKSDVYKLICPLDGQTTHVPHATVIPSQVQNVESKGMENFSRINSSQEINRHPAVVTAVNDIVKKPNVKSGSIISSNAPTDVTSVATDLLVNINPYSTPESSRSRHIYSYRTANTRARSLSNGRKYGKALINEYVGHENADAVDEVSQELLAKTAELLTSTRAEVDAMHSIDKRINTLDDSLLRHQVKRSQSVPAQFHEPGSTKPPSWIDELDGSSSSVKSKKSLSKASKREERKALAKKWLTEMEAEANNEYLNKTSASKADDVKSSFEKHLICSDNLRVGFSDVHILANKTNTKRSATNTELNRLTSNEEHSVDKMIVELDDMKEKFDFAATKIENLQSKNSAKEDKQRQLLSSTLNADNNDINELDDEEFSSISQRITGSKSNSNKSVSPKNCETEDSKQTGSMEMLKSMLFTLQSEASAISNSSATDQSASDLSANAQAGKEMVPSLEDYKFKEEPGGKSLQKALSHLNKLKTLVDTRTVTTT